MTNDKNAKCSCWFMSASGPKETSRAMTLSSTVKWGNGAGIPV